MNRRIQQYRKTGLSDLVGERIVNIEGLKKGSEEVTITTHSGNKFAFYHEQECCESVDLIDFEGDPSELKDALILSAELMMNREEPPTCRDYTVEYWNWSFYKIETSKGEIWMRWLGDSNGYYSEAVDFAKVIPFH